MVHLAKAAQTSQAPITSQERPIDLVHLAYQTLGDKALGLEVLHIYDKLAAGFATRLEAAHIDGDVKEMSMQLHTLKGAAAGVGARGVAAAAETAERELREAGAIEDETIADLAMAVEEASAFIVSLGPLPDPEDD